MIRKAVLLNVHSVAHSIFLSVFLSVFPFIIVFFQFAGPSLAGSEGASSPVVSRSIKYDGTAESIARARQARDRSPDNPDAWFDLAFAAKAAGALTEARECYLTILRRFPDYKHKAYCAAVAQRLEKEIKTRPESVMSRLSADDYCLVDRIAANGLPRWSPSAMPLKVFIAVQPDLRYRVELIKAARAALTEWQAASAGLISMREVPTVTGSDIEIVITGNVNDPSLPDRAGTTKYTFDYGTTSPQYLIKHARVMALAVSRFSGNPLPPSDVKWTIEHELGHALGLGHSKVSSDLMFSYGHSNMKGISPRDRLILEKIYKTPTQSLIAEAVIAVRNTGESMSPVLLKLYDAGGFSARLEKRDEDALAWYLKSIDLAKRAGIGEQKDSARRFHEVGRIYYALRNYRAAIPYYETYCRLIENDRKSLSRIYGILGYCYSQTDEYSKAQKAYQDQLNALETERQPAKEVAACLRRIAHSLYRQSKFKEAADYYKRAGDFCARSGLSNEVDKCRKGYDAAKRRIK